MDALIFLVEKRDTTMTTEESKLKSRLCADGSVQRSYISKDDASSPTASLESILLTAVIEARENRDVATIDVPNAFIQTDIDYSDKDEWITMKIQGIMVDMLVELDPEMYKGRIVYENGVKTIYVIVLKAIYGMLQSALQFYENLERT